MGAFTDRVRFRTVDHGSAQYAADQWSHLIVGGLLQ